MKYTLGKTPLHSAQLPSLSTPSLKDPHNHNAGSNLKVFMKMVVLKGNQGNYLNIVIT